ncbi:MAG: hypothetical protein R2695_02495 [Acidimicrobiales bacterium]
MAPIQVDAPLDARYPRVGQGLDDGRATSPARRRPPQLDLALVGGGHPDQHRCREFAPHRERTY